MASINRNKVGKFKIQDIVIETQPEIVLDVMSRVIVLNAKYLEIEGAYEYYGYSEMFDEIAMGEIVPEYEFIITRHPRLGFYLTDVRRRN